MRIEPLCLLMVALFALPAAVSADPIRVVRDQSGLRALARVLLDGGDSSGRQNTPWRRQSVGRSERIF